jgi:hypothetical protein
VSANRSSAGLSHTWANPIAGTTARYVWFIGGLLKLEGDPLADTRRPHSRQHVEPASRNARLALKCQYPLLPNEELDGDIGAAFAVSMAGMVSSEISARAVMNFLMTHLLMTRLCPGACNDGATSCPCVLQTPRRWVFALMRISYISELIR